MVLTLSGVTLPAPAARHITATDSVDYARVLYAALRTADDLGVAEFIAVPPSATGIGAAIIDRLTRAAHGSTSTHP